jgi:hypothetical protein
MGAFSALAKLVDRLGKVILVILEVMPIGIGRAALIVWLKVSAESHRDLVVDVLLISWPVADWLTGWLLLVVVEPPLTRITEVILASSSGRELQG